MNLNNVDKMILEHTKMFNRDQHKELMSAFRISQREPAVQVATAMFREAMVFNEMSKATIMQMRIEINQLRRDVERLQEFKE